MSPRTSPILHWTHGLLLAAWLGAPLAFSAVASAQARGPAQGDLIGLQIAAREAFRLERERLLLAAWLVAEEPQREELQRLATAGLDPRRSRLRPLRLQSVTGAVRAHHSPGQERELGAWFGLLDTLDLRVTPGIFAAREEGRGEAMTVHLQRVWVADFEGNLDQELKASLVWESPQGDEIVARTEPLTPRVLQRGFEMYVRPPLSQAGTWKLTLELQTLGGLLRSFPIEVECVADLAALRKRLASAVQGKSEALRQRLQMRLGLALKHGIRLAPGVPLGDWVRAYDHEPVQPGVQGLRALDGALFGIAGECFWELAGSGSAKRVLLLLCDEQEDPTDLLSGPQGQLWRALAQASGSRVIAGHVPLTATDLEPLQALAAALGAADEAPQLFIVARGNSGRYLPRLMIQKAWGGIDGLILSETIAAAVAPKPGFPTACLRLEFNADPAASSSSDSGQGVGRRTHVAIPRPAPLALPEALTAIATWIESM